MSIDYMQHRTAFICSIYKYIHLLAINSNLETTVTHNAFPAQGKKNKKQKNIAQSLLKLEGQGHLSLCSSLCMRIIPLLADTLHILHILQPKE